MPLFAERQRLAEQAAREAAGEDFWSECLPAQARVKIAGMWSVITESLGSVEEQDVRVAMTRMLQIGLGRSGLPTIPSSWSTLEDTALSLSILEALIRALQNYPREREGIEGFINQTFESYRIAFKCVDGEFVPFSSDEMHRNVIEPTLRLLTAQKFNDAHAAYMAGLKQISHQDAPNAITDAGTALQLVLIALGCQGNALGPLWKDAKKRGLLSPHDDNLFAGISKFVDWAGADRSTMGDGHKSSEAVTADAWLMMHIVGALILRLASDEPRRVWESPEEA